MSALDTVTSFETVQFIMVVGIGALALVAMIIRAKRKSDEQSYIETKESRAVNQAHELDVIHAKNMTASIPGNTGQKVLKAQKERD